MGQLKTLYFVLLVFCFFHAKVAISHPTMVDSNPSQVKVGTNADNSKAESKNTSSETIPAEQNNQATHSASQEGKTEDRKPIYIAIIIDDLGYKANLDRQAIALPGNLTYAFLPHAPFTSELAEKVHKQKREVMLHLPMQSHNKVNLGPGAITDDMNETEFNQTLQESLASVPHAKGVNNHMGSLITSSEEKMHWLMKNIAVKDLFFIDSRTTTETVAEKTANQYQIPNTRRNVFLDHYRTEKDIEYQFNRLIKLAKKYGSAVGIGHPFKSTLKILEKKLPELEQQGIQLISASELIAYQQHQGEKSWQMSLSHSQKVVKNSKPLPSSTCCEEPK